MTTILNTNVNRSHIDALNAYERSAVYQPFNSLSQAARVLCYKRREAKALAALEDMGFGGASLYPDHYGTTSDEYNNARAARSQIVVAYLGDRALRAATLGVAA